MEVETLVLVRHFATCSEWKSEEMLSMFSSGAYKMSSHYQASDFVSLIKLMEILLQTTPPLSHPFAAFCTFLVVFCFYSFF